MRLTRFFQCSFLGFLLLIGLGACVPIKTLTPVANPRLTYKQYQLHLEKLVTWRFSGLIGFRVPNKTGSATIHWQQQGKRFVIWLSGPLGLGANKLEGDHRAVQLTDAKGHVYTAANAEALMQKNLGWSVPVAGLTYWLKGVAVPNQASNITLNSYGALASLQQAGWLIEYSHYVYMNDLPMPGKIMMIQGNITLTLIINQWSLA